MRPVVFLLFYLAYELYHSSPTPILSLVTSLLCHTSKVIIYGAEGVVGRSKGCSCSPSPGQLTLPSPKAATLPWVSCYFNFI